MKTNTIFALGFFDGVHLGHQALLQACRELARELGCKAGVVTFVGHPDEVVSGTATPLINTYADRRRLFRHYGMETVVELPFDETLMRTPWQEFYRRLRQRYGAVGLVCGEDFRFGLRGQGTAQRLTQVCADDGIPCTVIPQLSLEGVPISSTHIRSLLEKGDVEQAEKFLGHRHILTGTVVKGQLRLSREHLCLPCGAYLCRTQAEDLGIVTIAKNDEAVTVALRPLDFDKDLEGKELTLEFYRRFEEERKNGKE